MRISNSAASTFVNQNIQVIASTVQMRTKGLKQYIFLTIWFNSFCSPWLNG